MSEASPTAAPPVPPEPSVPRAPANDLTITGLWRTARGRSLALLSACVLMLWAVMMSVFPALPAISAALHLAPQRLGLILAGSALLMTALNVPAGVLADRFGRRPPIVVGLAVSTLGVAIAGLWASAWLFVLGWGLLFGVGRGLFISPAFTVPADRYGPRERGKAIGIMASAIGVGAVLGFVVSGLLLSGVSWRAVLAVDAVVLAAATTVAATLLAESIPERRTVGLPVALAQTLRWYRERVVLLSGVVAGISFAAGVAATFLAPFSLSTLRASVLLIALVFIPYEVVASVGTMVTGALSDRYGRKTPMLGALLAVTVAVAALPLVGVSIVSFCVVYALIGLSEGPIISLATTMVTDAVLKTDPRRIGSALGANRLVQGVGPILGPYLGGLLAGRLSLAGRYWVIAGAVLLAAGLALLLPETHRRAVAA